MTQPLAELPYDKEPDIRTTKIYAKVGEKHLWEMFKQHHYMSHTLPRGAIFWTFYIKQDQQMIPIGCLGLVIQMNKLPAKRISRFVVLPEFQGLGFSKRILEAVSQYYLNNFFMIYIITFHPRLGRMLENSKNWTPTAHNQKENKTDHIKYIKVKSSSYIREKEKMFRFKFTPTEEIPIDYNVDLFDPDEKDKRIIRFNNDIHYEIQKALRKEKLQKEKQKKEEALDKQMVKGPLKKLRKKKKYDQQTLDRLKKMKGNR